MTGLPNSHSITNEQVQCVIFEKKIEMEGHPALSAKSFKITAIGLEKVQQCRSARFGTPSLPAAKRHPSIILP